MADEKSGIINKGKKGRFQVSVWKRTRVYPAKDFSPERKVEVTRACIQYSRKRNGQWENQRIWFRPEELRDLQHALDELDEGEQSPSEVPQ
jgi:hypothetical protein